MKKITLALFCLLIAAAVSLAQLQSSTRERRTGGQTPPATPSATPPQNEPPIEEDNEVLKINTTLVTIPVSVFDRTGRFISGLRKQDFQIYEDGRPQPLEEFATTEQPFNVVLLLDVSRSTQFKIEEIQDSAIAFVEQLRPQDKLTVIAFDDEIQILAEATSDKRQLRNAIRRIQLGGGTRLYDAVDIALHEYLGGIEGRKAVVLFSDGVDSSSRDANFASTVSDAERSDIIFYSIRYDTSDYFGSTNTQNKNRFPFPRRRSGGGIQLPFPWPGSGSGNGGGGNNRGGGSQQQDEAARGESYMKELSDKTAGRFYNADTTVSLESAFVGIAEELRQQYSLSYYPEKEGNPGQRKQISVRVARANVSVKAKSSYVVGAQEKSNKFPVNRLSAN